MTKADIVDAVAERLGCPKKEALTLVEQTFDLMKDVIVEDGHLAISGFGQFLVRQKSDRRGRNPQTGEEIVIGSRRVLTFKSSQKLRNRINGVEVLA